MLGRASILAVLAMFVLSAMILRTISRSTTAQSDNLIRYNQRITGRNVAQTGVNLALRNLASNSLWRAGYSSLSVAGGTVSVSLRDTVYKRDAVSPLIAAIKITSVSTVPFLTAVSDVSRRDTVFTTIAYVPRGFVPKGPPGFGITAVVMTHNPITTSGHLIIDGEDHDTTAQATLLPGQGTLGIWTTSTLTQKGNSRIGGTNIGTVDITPAGNADTSIIRQHQPEPYPASPDSVMGGTVNGYPEGTLRSIAQSGINGSQYVTNPSNLHSPFSGVTYIELPPGGAWVPAEISGSGILVVHSSARDAVMGNVHGTFQGIIIADDIAHINSGTTILGAIVALSTDPSKFNDFSNGTSSILYSSLAIEQATARIQPIVINTYTNKVIAWWE
jgi:hypothetical protein